MVVKRLKPSDLCTLHSSCKIFLRIRIVILFLFCNAIQIIMSIILHDLQMYRLAHTSLFTCVCVCGGGGDGKHFSFSRREISSCPSESWNFWRSIQLKNLASVNKLNPAFIDVCVHQCSSEFTTRSCLGLHNLFLYFSQLERSTPPPPFAQLS